MNFLQYCKSREVRIEISHRLEDDTFHFIFYHEDGYAQQFVLSSLEANALDRNL
jgi:CCR4-NOT transcriptional regulation complex NOT5 subunit